MGYKNYAILKDVNNKPVPQYWNPMSGSYEIVTGRNGKLHSILTDSNGDYVDLQDKVDQINVSINELVRVVENIGL